MLFKNISLLVVSLILSYFINIGNFSVHALVPSDISDQVFFLDAQNVDGDNNSGNEPANNTQVAEIIDTFNAFTGSQVAGAKQPLYKTNSINSFPSLEFNGTSQYLNITDNQTINTATGYSQKSFSMILKTGTDISTFQTIYEEGGKEKGFSVQLDGGKLYAGAYNSLDWANPNEYKIIDLGTIASNTIYTVTLIFDSDNDFVNGYLDGNLISTLTTITAQVTHGSCIFDAGIGCSMYTSGDTSIGIGATKNDVLRLSNTTTTEILEGNYFSGNIGEISSWNTALSAAEITGLNDYYQSKWFPDPNAPVIISSNFGNNAVLPGGNHDLVFYYDDFHEGSSGVNTSSANLIFEKWDGTTWQSSAGIGAGTVTAISAGYTLSGASYGKYRASFSIADVAGNTSTIMQRVLYVDAPEMLISTGSIDIGLINSISETYAPDITITVKTIGAPFRIKLEKNQTLVNTPELIPYYNLTTGFGFDKDNNSTLDDIGVNEIVGSEIANINTNGLLNTYTYTVKVGALVDAQQQAGDYSGLIDFSIDLDYLNEYSNPTTETSCKTLVDKYGTNIGSGVYTINPGSGDIDVYCDMVVAGGGWTMVKRAGKLGRNGKVDSDRIGVMTEDAQIGSITDLVPSGSEFSKMSDTQINTITFGEIMLHQDSTGDRVFVIDNIIDSDHLIEQVDVWVYKKGILGTVNKSSLNSTNNGCSKYGIYITEDTSATPNGGGFRSCAGSMVVSNGGYIHTFDNNGFGVNQPSVYTNTIGDEWVR